MNLQKMVDNFNAQNRRKLKIYRTGNRFGIHESGRFLLEQGHSREHAEKWFDGFVSGKHFAPTYAMQKFRAKNTVDGKERLIVVAYHLQGPEPGLVRGAWIVGPNGETGLPKHIREGSIQLPYVPCTVAEWNRWARIAKQTTPQGWKP